MNKSEQETAVELLDQARKLLQAPKSPQRQAKDLSHRASEYFRVSHEGIAGSITTIIPVAELIAVAQAAAEKDLGFDYRMNTPTDRKLRDAVAALRATGKVEL